MQRAGSQETMDSEKHLKTIAVADEDQEEKDQESMMVKSTVSAMLNTPHPVDYLTLLMTYRLLDDRAAKLSALEYIKSVNRFHGFIQMSYYNIEPYVGMTLPSLLEFIRFIQKHRLDAVKGQKQFSSMF
jgi:hypothetical protein